MELASIELRFNFDRLVSFNSRPQGRNHCRYCWGTARNQSKMCKIKFSWSNGLLVANIWSKLFFFIKCHKIQVQTIEKYWAISFGPPVKNITSYWLCYLALIKSEESKYKWKPTKKNLLNEWKCQQRIYSILSSIWMYFLYLFISVCIYICCCYFKNISVYIHILCNICHANPNGCIKRIEIVFLFGVPFWFLCCHFLLASFSL